jgi:hypothetical protein
VAAAVVYENHREIICLAWEEVKKLMTLVYSRSLAMIGLCAKVKLMLGKPASGSYK